VLFRERSIVPDLFESSRRRVDSRIDTRRGAFPHSTLTLVVAATLLVQIFASFALQTRSVAGVTTIAPAGFACKRQQPASDRPTQEALLHCLECCLHCDPPQAATRCDVVRPCAPPAIAIVVFAGAVRIPERPAGWASSWSSRAPPLFS